MINSYFGIDDKYLIDIFKRIDFLDIKEIKKLSSIENIGNLYEQFLKPEVRKAGGVYYTPQYIVNYIIENAVGEKIKDKSPDDIAEIKILDPACGSGSFLIGAYGYLLDYHIKWYTDEKKIKKALKDGKIYQVKENDYHLSTEEKQKILLNNIFGVDIDSQAVEVTKLSLLLKLMEYETIESRGEFFKHSDLRQMLPNLSNNIKCGNSLIGSDFYADKDMKKYEKEKIREINAFDWDKQFLAIMQAGGFDVVVGNPPYVKEYTDKEAFIFKEGKLGKYYMGKMDLWYAFSCLAIDLLKESGLHSFIATNNWITSAGAISLRNKIFSDSIIKQFIDFHDYKVFQDASVQTMIYIIYKHKPCKKYNVNYLKIVDNTISERNVIDILNGIKTDMVEKFRAIITPDLMKNSIFTFMNENINFIIEKIYSKTNYKLLDSNVAQGIVLPQDFIIKSHLSVLKDKNLIEGEGIFVLTNKEKKKNIFEKNEIDILKPFYTTKQIHKYYADNKNELWVIYSDSKIRNNIKNYPNIKKHLEKFKDIITSDFAPYGLHRARDQRFFEGEKIISLRKTKNVCFTYVDFPCYVSQTYFIIKPDDINLKYLIAVLNSKLINFWLYYKGKKQGDQLQIDKVPLLDIPIIKILDRIFVEDKFVSLVDQMLSTQQQLHTAQTEADKEIYKQKADLIDKQIDVLVYKLYDLTAEEIRIIEQGKIL